MEPGSWVKAKDVLFEAFQRPAGEREGFVRERCSDPELCAAILSLLEASPTTPDSREKSSDVRSRILHEARAAARLSSQHIAAVHDVVEHDSRVFIVMEYVEGETLAARNFSVALGFDLRRIGKIVGP